MTAGVQTRTLADRTIQCHLADSSTAGSAFALSLFNGAIIELWAVIFAAITGSDNVVTAKINGTTITGGTLTLATAASAGGSSFSAEPTAANLVKPGDYVEFASDGAGGGTVPTTFYALIRDL